MLSGDRGSSVGIPLVASHVQHGRAALVKDDLPREADSQGVYLPSPISRRTAACELSVKATIGLPPVPKVGTA